MAAADLARRVVRRMRRLLWISLERADVLVINAFAKTAEVEGNGERHYEKDECTLD